MLIRSVSGLSNILVAILISSEVFRVVKKYRKIISKLHFALLVNCNVLSLGHVAKHFKLCQKHCKKICLYSFFEQCFVIWLNVQTLLDE